MDIFICNNCGYSTKELSFHGEEFPCPNCAGIMRRQEHRQIDPPVRDNIQSGWSSTVQKTPKRIRTTFIGGAGEYFRIWIVNLFLTVMTLGIYGAWAKVRTRRYFYANTMLAAHPFDYLANPFAILKGNLIIAAGFIIYLLTQAFNPIFTGVVILMFYLILPFLIYKSLRFLTHNSSFRNIRFHFHGTLWESYKIYIMIPVLIPLTLGLITPYWAYRRKKYFFDNVSYGTTPASFQARPGYFYKVYLKAALLAIITVICIGIAMRYISSFTSNIFLANPESPGAAVFVYMILVYLFMIILITLIQQYIYARITNYCWKETRLGDITFNSTLQARELFRIQFTNILAIIFSLGMLIPWAKIRRSRYIFANMMISAAQSLDEFFSETEPEVNALGDAATDFFDLDIGL